ncbi:hypothetical protein AB0383_20075 [Amycolatopsis sp. NPDC051373]|uniref:hypothetical protein n=1 Tax=Amycolatopsis sp. NPDC051373 TaxID=3155801 RepID=UPI00344F54B2
MDVQKRFVLNTADHAMTVLHDDGLYRHLRFQQEVWRPPLVKPRLSSIYWFELITVPGSLVFRGDGESFVFAHDTDMFAFFRMSAWQGRPNLSYWAEKVTSEQSALKKYDEELFVRTIREHFVEEVRDGGVPPGASKVLLSHAEDYDLMYEEQARAMLDDFEHRGFRFYDTWEWDFRDYDWWFVWACHAIVWGIRQYDAVKADRPAPGHAPREISVELPAVA